MLLASTAALAQAPAYRIDEAVLDAPGLVGLSDLSADASGRLWAISERQRLLVPLAIDGDRASLAGPLVTVAGLPEGLDAEALAFLEDGTLALGTEQRGKHESDGIFRMTISAHQARRSGAIELDYGIVAKSNRGIEGLCRDGGALIVATEVVEEVDGERFALVARYHLATRAWERFRVRLTTQKGRLSAIACRTSGELLAIERHQTTGRLLRFTLATPVATLEAELPAGFNPEGVVWLDDGRVVVLTDNSDEREPTRLFTLTPVTVAAGAHAGTRAPLSPSAHAQRDPR